mmetsp:Transcript_19953/g.43394  ORF Transcript_19953/g.43394 Transcript_19953/m.43394 type:complete len:114 (-) Transcript_19953:2096-2437(-)
MKIIFHSPSLCCVLPTVSTKIKKHFHSLFVNCHARRAHISIFGTPVPSWMIQDCLSLNEWNPLTLMDLPLSFRFNRNIMVPATCTHRLISLLNPLLVNLSPPTWLLVYGLQCC